jgi:hypothetical protein
MPLYVGNVSKNRFLLSSLVIFSSLFQTSCLEEDAEDSKISSKEEETANNNRILELEKEITLLKWENSRLSLKLRSVDGATLVRDVQTNLWHFDVERTPYTGNATENFKNGKPRAEASFLKGKRDGVARYWHENGILKLEEQWFDGKEDGLFREWDDEGQLLKALRYKRGELIEVLKN